MGEKVKRKAHPKTMEIRKELYRKLKAIAKEQKLGMSTAAYMVGINTSIGSRMGKGGDISFYSFLRLAYMFGYEVTLSRSDNPTRWQDDKLLTQRHELHKTKQINAKRRERGLPEGGPIIRVRTKGKSGNDSRVIVISRKSIQDVHNEQDDIFSTT